MAAADARREGGVRAQELTDLAAQWLRKRHPQALIVREFSVSEYGGALVDVAAILEREIVAVEVKGEGDSPARLPLQGMMYSRACRSVYLLSAPSMQERCAKHLPPGWGMLSPEKQNGYGWRSVADLFAKSGCDKGYGLAPVTLAAMPWTTEYGRFSAELGWSVPSRKAACIKAVARHEPVEKIEAAVCGVLRRRDWQGKSVDRPAADAAPKAELSAYDRAVAARAGRLL